MTDTNNQLISKEIMKKVFREHPKALEEANTEEGQKSIRRAVEIYYTISLIAKALLLCGVWVLISWYDRQLAELFVVGVALVELKLITDKKFEGLGDMILDVAVELKREEVKTVEDTTEKSEDVSPSGSSEVNYGPEIKEKSEEAEA